MVVELFGPYVACSAVHTVVSFEFVVGLVQHFQGVRPKRCQLLQFRLLYLS